MTARPPKARPLLRSRAVWLGLLALLIAGVAAYFYFSGRPASRQWKLAEEALDRHDLPTACDHLRRYLDERPNSPEGHFLMARTLRRRGTFDKAERHLTEARRLGWDPEAIRREAALAQLQRSDVRQRPGDYLMSLVQGANPEKPLLEARASAR